MSISRLNLFQKCHVNTNVDTDRFVGIKVIDGEPIVCFPIGYHLPQEDTEVRKEILSLLTVLGSFGKRKYAPMEASDMAEGNISTVTLYLEIIKDYLERRGYFTEREILHHKSTRGKINWGKTIKKIRPLPGSNEGPVFTEFIVRYSPPAERNEITQIHKYCVYQCFQVIGWLFTNFHPEKSLLKFDKNRFLSVIVQKANQTNNDRDKKLMNLLKLFVEQKDIEGSGLNIIYGTDNFEYIWEGLIDKIFGVKNKEEYFPKTKWKLKTGNGKWNAPLEPDTILLFQDKIYVLDAKYYKFGITGQVTDLPESTSINKQVTYGEYVARKYYPQTPDKDIPVFNAFLMPYNAAVNNLSCVSDIENIGEAVGDWKRNSLCKYEKIQGILIDTRYLIHNGISPKQSAINRLVEAIDAAFENGTTM